MHLTSLDVLDLFHAQSLLIVHLKEWKQGNEEQMCEE